MPADRVTGKTPWHVLFVLDDSASMQGPPAQTAGQGVRAMIEEMRLISGGMKPYFRVSIVRFGSQAEVLCEAVSEQDIDLDSVTALTGSSGSTAADLALKEAARILMNRPGEATDFNPYVFFCSDGEPDDAGDALSAGQALKGLNLAAGAPRLVTIGFGAVNHDFMRNLASNPELYKSLSDYKELLRFLPQIGSATQAKGGVQGVDAVIMNI